MKTLKSNFHQKLYFTQKFLEAFSHEELIRVGCYCLEDCIHMSSNKEVKKCLNLTKKWLSGEEISKTKLKEASRKIRELLEHHLYDSKEYFEQCVFRTSILVIESIYKDNIQGLYRKASREENIAYAVQSASYSFGRIHEIKKKEYENYSFLFAYEDLDFPYRKEAKAFNLDNPTFNLDNPTDLNIFLDFLTDHYPEAITYPREEYFTNKLAKEYLKVIYQ